MSFHWNLRPMSLNRSLRYLGVLILYVSLGMLGVAQDSNVSSVQGLRVAFVEDDQLDAVTRNEEIGDSLSALVASLDAFELEPIVVNLREPLSPDIDLIVLIRPQRQLSLEQTVHLWEYLQSGGNLLLALDPNGHNNTNTESSRSGIIQLIETEYGIKVNDDILIDPWLDNIPLFELISSWSDAIPDNVTPHAITAPLVTYDLPVRFWGGRSVNVESVTGIARTNGLLFTESAYGEVSRFDLNDTETEQFILNIGEDSQGRLLLAAVAENYETGSRIAIVGDSEIFQDGLGLKTEANEADLPQFAGSYIFAQRLTQWALDIPEELWLPLPETLTWIAVDGQVDDWDTIGNSLFRFTDEVSSDISPVYDIQGIRLFHNNSYVYVDIETVAEPDPTSTINLQFTVNNSTIDVSLENDAISYVDANGASNLIPDADYAVADHIEVRIPLRVAGPTPTLSQVCVQDSTASESDCYEGQMSSTLVQTTDPNPVRFEQMPTAFVLIAGNLLEEPEGNVITRLPIDTQLVVLGRNQDGTWLRVANARYEGWIDASLVEINSRISRLTIVG